jgi:glycerol uptake facilitator-like aquaporin
VTAVSGVAVLPLEPGHWDAGGAITGASMNPARSAGPALVSGDPHTLWIYLRAPIAGTAVGVAAYQLVRASPGERAA